MSYDVYLKIHTGKSETTVVDVGNYTSNIWEMYENAMPPAVEGQRGGLHRLHGMKAGDAIEHLSRAIQRMQDDKVFYRKFEPANGWGNYTGALKFLREIRQACEDHPACTIELSA